MGGLFDAIDEDEEAAVARSGSGAGAGTSAGPPAEGLTAPRVLGIAQKETCREGINAMHTRCGREMEVW